MDEANERVFLDARRHGVVLAWPLAQAVALAGAGLFLLLLPWPAPIAGAVMTCAGAIIAVSTVWRWDRTRLVITSEKIFLVRGISRRRASAVMLRSVQTVGLEQSLAGRAFGYGTLMAGPLQVSYVPEARQVSRLVERLCG